MFAITLPAEQAELQRVYGNWSRHPDLVTLPVLLDQIYFVYLTDGQNPTLRSFYNALRTDPQIQTIIAQFRLTIIQKYTFDEETPETPALWVMPTMDARRLFLTYAVNQNGIPAEILHAMFKGIYSDIERCFAFDLTFRGKLGVFPEPEYRRLMEILVRISSQDDSFLKSWDLYCRAIVALNLKNRTEADNYLRVSQSYLKQLLSSSNAVLAKKIILLRIAETSELLERFSDAEAAYVQVLQMDPQDFHALSGLEKILQKTGECHEEAIWIEATAKSNQQLYNITIHCGSQELPENPTESSTPMTARYSLEESSTWLRLKRFWG